LTTNVSRNQRLTLSNKKPPIRQAGLEKRPTRKRAKKKPRRRKREKKKKKKKIPGMSKRQPISYEKQQKLIQRCPAWKQYGSGLQASEKKEQNCGKKRDHWRNAKDGRESEGKKKSRSGKEDKY